MKSIHAILQETGISVPEEKQADFDKVFKENYKTVAEVEKIETTRDNYKNLADTAQSQLKAFEGVDVSELKGKISKLQADLEKRDGEYSAKISDMEFNGALDNALSAAKAKNVKAVKALLDVDALKASKNQSEDIKAAISDAQKENGYLFVNGKEPPAVTVPGNPAPQQSDAKGYIDSFYANNPFYKK